MSGGVSGRDALRIGDAAPSFTLPGFAPLTGAPLGDIALRDLRGRPVVLIFLRWLG